MIQKSCGAGLFDAQSPSILIGFFSSQHYELKGSAATRPLCWEYSPESFVVPNKSKHDRGVSQGFIGIASVSAPQRLSALVQIGPYGQSFELLGIPQSLPGRGSAEIAIVDQ